MWMMRVRVLAADLLEDAWDDHAMTTRRSGHAHTTLPTALERRGSLNDYAVKEFRVQ